MDGLPSSPVARSDQKGYYKVGIEILPGLAHVRITKRIVLEDLRDVLEHDQRAGGTFGTLKGHG